MEPSRPPVTIRDPRRPMEGRDVLLDDAPDPPAGRRVDRRWLRGGVATAVAAAALLVVADVRDDRRTAARERRLDGVVQVYLAAPSSYTGALGPRSGRGTVELALRLQNTGPRDVTLTQAQQGDLRFSGAVPLEALTGTALVRLTRSVRCPPSGRLPDVEPESPPLLLEVVTPAGTREAAVPDARPIGSLNEALRSACGYPPLERAVTVGGVVLGPRDRTVEVRVEVTNTSRWRARLISLYFGRGLGVLSIDGQSDVDALPLSLPPAAEGGPAVRAVQVVVGLDCGGLISSTSLRPLEEVNVVVDDGTGMHIGQVSRELSDPEALLRKHAYKICVSG